MDYQDNEAILRLLNHLIDGSHMIGLVFVFYHYYKSLSITVSGKHTYCN